MAGTKSKNRKKRSAGSLSANHSHTHSHSHEPSDDAALLQGRPQSWLQRIFVAIIRFYQLTISRALPSSCRFTPSCSEYTRQAIMKYGAIKGSWMGAKRIARCHPFHPGGYDPVP